MRVLPLLVLSAALFASSTSAQSPKAAAEALYNDGRRLMTDGHYSEACAKFEESQRLDPGSGTQLNLAHCLEKLGKTASAWAEYKEAAAAARAGVEAARQELAEKGAAQLEPGLSKVRISAPNVLPGLAVKLDGVALGSGSLGADIPVDPGNHTLEATAPGHIAYKITLTIGASGDKKVVTIPALAVDPGASTAAAAPATAPAPAPWGTQRTVGVVVGAAGVVGLVVGAVFGAKAISKNNASQARCLPSDLTRCDSEGISLGNDGRSAATVSTVGFIAGGAALLGGTILFITAPSGTPKAKIGSRTIQARPLLGSRAGALVVSGEW